MITGRYNAKPMLRQVILATGKRLKLNNKKN